MHGEEIKIKNWYLCGAILFKNFPGGNVAERHFGKRKQHGERHSSVNMQVYFRKDDWMDFSSASVLRAPGKIDGGGGRKGR